MITAEFLVNAYIDANILLILTAVAIILSRSLLSWAGYGSAFRAQLGLVTGLLVTMALVPVISFACSFISNLAVPHASDILVAQFLNGRIEMSATEFGQMLGLRERIVAEIASPSIAVTQVLLAVGLAILALIITRIMRNIGGLRAVLRAAYTIRNQGRIRIMSSDGITVPFTARGLWAYYVVIPVQILGDSAETKIALGHELQHIRQGDVEWEIALELLRPLFFLNPAYWAIRRQLRSLREYACDQEFLARSGVDRRSYGTCLIDVAQRAMAHRNAPGSGAFSVPLIESSTILRASNASNLGRRINALTQTATRGPTRHLLCVLTLPVSIALVVAAQSIQQPQGWSHDRIMLTTVINLERLHNLNATNNTFASPD